ncbi:hypothetical protein EDB19DRAFT_1833589 [Suillus lakei]|nr:hypothetical protein EDB19DRAFT_1833589 [Suillus lakei]
MIYDKDDCEVLITILRQIKSAYDTTPVKTHEAAALKMLHEIWPNQDKNAQLLKTLKQLTSNDPCPDYKSVSELLEKVDVKDPEAKEKVKELCKLITDCRSYEESDMSIWSEVISSLDEHAKAAFQEFIRPIGEMMSSYIMPLSTYQQHVIETLQDAWSLSASTKPGDSEDIKHHDKVVARITVLLTPMEGTLEAPEPLLRGFMLDYVWAAFIRIQGGIMEQFTSQMPQRSVTSRKGSDEVYILIFMLYKKEATCIEQSLRDENEGSVILLLISQLGVRLLECPPNSMVLSTSSSSLFLDSMILVEGGGGGGLPIASCSSRDPAAI